MISKELNCYYGSPLQTIQENTDETYPLDEEINFVDAFLNSPFLVENIIQLVQRDVEREEEARQQIEELVQEIQNEYRVEIEEYEVGNPIVQTELFCNLCEQQLSITEYMVEDLPVCEFCFNECVSELNNQNRNSR